VEQRLWETYQMMKMQKIYIDTSVIGGCFDNEFSKWSNGLVRDFQKGIFIPVLSEVVSIEIVKAPRNVREKYAEIASYNAIMLEITEEVGALAEVYRKRKILTPKFSDDMLHIALSTVAKVDILVSWNFKHIVHFDKIRQFNSVNLELGYMELDIYSPREVTSYEK
jgi:predicted nucleic acid-binding protein